MTDGGTCSIGDCCKPVRARGWCATHYQRWQKHGDPRLTKTPTLTVGTLEQRFWAKVGPPNEDGCREWTGKLHPQGYGYTSVRGKKVGAHRMSYELQVGPIPEGMEIDHVYARGCRSRACVEIRHLEAVTHQVNTRRSSLGAVNAARQRSKTHCKNNHEFTPSNTKTNSRGARVCVTCANEAEKRYRAKRKAMQK